MGSQHCIMVVKNIITTYKGAGIDAIEIGKADISINNSKTSIQKITMAIEKMGYKVEQ